AGLLGVLAFGVAIVGLTASLPIIPIVLLVIGVAAASQEALTVIAVRRSSPSGLAAAVARTMVLSSGAGQVIGAIVVAAGARTLGVTGALIATAFVGLAVTVLLALILEGPSAFRPLRAEAAR
ncbi:MAG: hypothetical protein H0V04_08250, partial [Chloroflexi bacterium]|nr:hypothetical protein [Chloroflexota bacterium]